MTHQRTIFIASKHREPEEGRTNGLAPMGYGFFSATSSPPKLAYGCGLEKSTEAMLAHGMIRAIQDAVRDDHDAKVTVIVRNAGTLTYFKQHIPLWFREEGTTDAPLKRDNWPTWRDLHLSGIIANMTFREAANVDERRQLANVERLTKAATDLADTKRVKIERAAYEAGVFFTDEMPNAPAPEMLVAHYDSQV